MKIHQKCPSCGTPMQLTPQQPGSSYMWAECLNPECEMWGHKFDLDGLKRMPDYAELLKDRLFEPTQVRCRECGAVHADNYRLIHHKRGCHTGKFIRTH